MNCPYGLRPGLTLHGNIGLGRRAQVLYPGTGAAQGKRDSKQRESW